MANGDPTGAALASHTNNIVAGVVSNQFTLDTTYSIMDTKQYAWVFSTTGLDATHYVRITQDLGAGYGGGLKCISDDIGSTWTQVGTRDIYFQSKAGGVVKDSFTDGAGTQAIYGDYWVAQTWTATSSYTVDEFYGSLQTSGAPNGTITVALYKVEGELYGTAVDATGTVAGVSSITGTATVGASWQTSSIAQARRLIAIGNNEVWYEDI